MRANLTRLASLLFLTLIAASGFVYLALGGQPQPNIIVIMADDLGFNDVGFHGSDEIPTPNIDALAFNGVLLQRHYVLPVCTPSRTAFLSGRYPIRTGMQGYPLKAGEKRAIPLSYTLLPQHLKKLGYSTHLVGKWHVGYYSDLHTPANRGFDTFLGYYNGYVTYFNHTVQQNNHTGYDLHYDTPGNLSVKYSGDYLTSLITKRAEDLIANRDPSKPLYLQLSHLAVHSTDSEEVMEVPDKSELNATLGYIEDYNRRKFAGVMVAMDESIGKVIEALKKADILENSIIVFMSDNGAPTEGLLQNYGSNYPLRGLKFTLWEGGVRGVACVYSPLIKSPSRISDHLIHITDWLPTFYAAAGGDLNDLGENLDGVNQWPALINSEEENPRKDLLLNIDDESELSGALKGRYKLITGAKREFGDYYGDSGRSDSNPLYNASEVLESPAGSAIASVSTVKLSIGNVAKLRESATVVCNDVSNYPSCVGKKCLFDVFEDPCETTDLSGRYPEIVNELSDYIERFNSVAMRIETRTVDPHAYPENFNGTWMPWIKSSCDIF